MEYIEQLEKQNRELQDRLAAAEEDLYRLRRTEQGECGTVKIVVKDFNSHMSMSVIDMRVLKDNPEMIQWELQKLIAELEYRTRIKPLYWCPIPITPTMIGTA